MDTHNVAQFQAPLDAHAFLELDERRSLAAREQDWVSRVASRRVASHSSVALSFTTLPRSARSPLLTFLVSDDSDVNQGTALGLLDDLTEVVLLRLGVEVFYVDGGGVSRELEMARHDEVLRRVKKVRSKLIGLVLV